MVAATFKHSVGVLSSHECAVYSTVTAARGIVCTRARVCMYVRAHARVAPTVCLRGVEVKPQTFECKLQIQIPVILGRLFLQRPLFYNDHSLYLLVFVIMISQPYFT